MKITRRSLLSGKTRTREIEVSEEAIELWQDGTLIQDAMPNVSEDDREFIITGITPEEWNEFFDKALDNVEE